MYTLVSLLFSLFFFLLAKEGYMVITFPVAGYAESRLKVFLNRIFWNVNGALLTIKTNEIN